LKDGRFMVIGGSTGASSSQATAAVWLYDPGTGHWSAAASMHHARAYPMGVLLADGSVLVAGGSADGLPLDSVERYLPSNGTWVAAQRMNVARTEGSLIALQDGRVLVAGGGIEGSPGYGATASAEIYDPNDNSWTMTAPMSVARTLQTATLLKDGGVLVAGGATAYYTSAAQLTSSVEVFDPKSNTWRQTSPLPMPLYTHAASLLADGRVLVTGGFSSSADSAPSLDVAFTYDPATGQWSTAAPLSAARAEHTMLRFPDGRVLAMGGVDGSNNVLRTSEIYDPVANTWTLTGSLPVAVFWPAAGILADGSVLVAGGSTDVTGSGTTARCEIYTPPPG
jgi:N-acetylneuraminic acid mutarotase